LGMTAIVVFVDFEQPQAISAAINAAKVNVLFFMRISP